MKTPFVTKDQLEAIAAQYPTPFHIYDEQHPGECPPPAESICLESRLPGVFRREGAPTPALLKLLHEEGCGCELFLHDGADDLGAVRHHR